MCHVYEIWNMNIILCEIWNGKTRHRGIESIWNMKLFLFWHFDYFLFIFFMILSDDIYAIETFITPIKAIREQNSWISILSSNYFETANRVEWNMHACNKSHGYYNSEKKKKQTESLVLYNL